MLYWFCETFQQNKGERYYGEIYRGLTECLDACCDRIE